MQVHYRIDETRHFLRTIKRNGASVGLVPTMGALHEGHLQLVREALKKNDHVVCSIFVNPTQFNNPDDLKKYPRALSRDLDLLESVGCHQVFVPEADEMYPTKPELSIHFGTIESQLEGKFRPGHFRGVGLVVSKLFNIIVPDDAFFGQKDLQQFFIIKKLVDELSFPVNLILVPIVRESSGLAMSSRNERLSSSARKEAAFIYEQLEYAEAKLKDNIPWSSVRLEVEDRFKAHSSLVLEYFELIETKQFQPLESMEGVKDQAICIAAEIEGVRLIDNLLLFS